VRAGKVVVICWVSGPVGAVPVRAVAVVGVTAARVGAGCSGRRWGRCRWGRRGLGCRGDRGRGATAAAGRQDRGHDDDDQQQCRPASPHAIRPAPSGPHNWFPVPSLFQCAVPPRHRSPPNDRGRREFYHAALRDPPPVGAVDYNASRRGRVAPRDRRVLTRPEATVWPNDTDPAGCQALTRPEAARVYCR
jgi:hypothetical protein